MCVNLVCPYVSTLHMTSQSNPGTCPQNTITIATFSILADAVVESFDS